MPRAKTTAAKNTRHGLKAYRKVGKKEQILAIPAAEKRQTTPPATEPEGYGITATYSVLDLLGTTTFSLKETYDKAWELYTTVPYIGAAVDTRVLLVLKNRWSILGGSEEARRQLSRLVDKLNLYDALKPVLVDYYVYGHGAIEVVYERNPEPSELLADVGIQVDDRPSAWLIRDYDEKTLQALNNRINAGDPLALKPLDASTIRVRGDEYGRVWGYVQIVGAKIIPFRAFQILHFRHMPRSRMPEAFYGTSLIKRVFKTQALLTQFENDLASLLHIYAKPMLVARVGVGSPAPVSPKRITAVRDVLQSRGVGSDLIVPADVEINSVSAMAPRTFRYEEYLRYLEEQREAALGIPNFFMLSQGGRIPNQFMMETFLASIKDTQHHFAQIINRELLWPYARRHKDTLDIKTDEDIPTFTFNPPIITLRDKAEVAQVLVKAGLWSDEDAQRFLELESEVYKSED